MRAARIILSKAADLPQKEGNLFNMWATLETREVRASVRPSFRSICRSVQLRFFVGGFSDCTAPYDKRKRQFESEIALAPDMETVLIGYWYTNGFFF